MTVNKNQKEVKVEVEEQEDPNTFRINRRNAMKGAGLLAGTTLLGPSMYSREAEALAPIPIAIGLGAGMLLMGGGIKQPTSEGDDSSADALHEAVYTWAAGIEDRQVRKLTETESLVDATVGAVYSDAKLAAMNAVRDGATVTETQSAVSEAINEFYSQQFETVIYAQESTLNQVEQYANQFNELDVEKDFRSIHDDRYFERKYDGFYMKTIQLPNGEELEFKQVVYDDNDTTTYNLEYVVHPDNLDDVSTYNLEISSPFGDGETAQYADFNTFKNIIEKIQSARENAQSEINQIIEDVFESVSQDELEEFMTDDFVNSTDRIRTDVDGWADTENSAYTADLYNELGLQTSKTGADFTIEYTPYTEEDEPAMLDDPSGEMETIEAVGVYATQEVDWGEYGIQSNMAYDTADLGGVVQIAELLGNGSTEIRTLEGEIIFTMVTQDGEEVEELDVYDPQFQTSDTSNLREQYEALEQAREEYEAEKPNSGGAGFGSWRQALAVGGVGAAIIYLLTE